jgi:signal transduction histidine kinase
LSARLSLLGSYAALAGGYYLAARLGLGFRFDGSQVGIVWPANAVLLCALLLAPRSRWWLVFAVTAAAHVAAGVAVPWWRLLWQIAGNAVFTTAMLEVLRRSAGLPPRFGSTQQVLAYAGVAFALPVLYAFTTPAFVRAVLGFETVHGPAAALMGAALSNTTALLLLAPMLLLWAAAGEAGLQRALGRRRGEAALVLVALFAVGLLEFGTGPAIAGLPWLLLWTFPPLIWAAVRFGPLGASTALFVMAALSVLGTARQLGPFVLVGDAERVLSLQMFWIVLSLPVMLLAAAIHEREQVEHALHEQRNLLAHAVRVATVGELSGSLAHELRQPLTSILANAQAGLRMLGRPPLDLEEMRDILQDITQQDRQAAAVITRLREFLKQGESRFEPLAVDAVVGEALALSRNAVLTSGVEVDTRLEQGLPPVRGDRVQLLQVLLNLVVNSCESMSAAPAPRERRLSVHALTAGEQHVEVLIADSGTGLPQGGEERVFEPFFTTKARGLGLGLSIGRSIAASHGGRLWAENNPGGGATFHLVLPRDAPAPRQARP